MAGPFSMGEWAHGGSNNHVFRVGHRLDLRCYLYDVRSTGSHLRVFKKAKEPENIQNGRLDQLEAQVKKFAEYLDRDNKRLNAVDEGNRITQRALLALMSHAINGNDIDELIKAKKSLQDYLIDKGGMEV